MSEFCLVLGTNNQKKRRELCLLLEPYDIVLKTLGDFEDAIEVEETGTTFEENAILKAREQALVLKQWVMAEDSGLSVAALDGAPGVYSARYSGEGATDQKNNTKLLEALDGVPLSNRTAWYSCHMCLADPKGNIHISTNGECYGRILPDQKGDAGFGYDPMFEIPEMSRTFGELGDNVKSVISHRARAMRQFLPKLLLIAAREGTRADH
jgi:XTP/dITP diphosphohydrolase